MDFRDHNELGNGPYNARSKLYEDRWGFVDLHPTANSTSYDISESFLQYYGRDLSVTVGRGRHRWGPSHFGSLFLNSRMPPFDYARFDAALEARQSSRAVYYTFLHGWLESQQVADTLYIAPGGRARTINAQKYLSAQRLEIRPRGNLLLGFSQGVIYGDRGLQLGYLTPLNFLYSVQHANDDKDNMVLAIDGTWRVRRGVKLYGEFFFDDIIVSELLTSSRSNKSAYTVGSELTGVSGFLQHLDLRTEFTRVRPFVYSHVFATNVYTHWTSPVGYTLQPNSERWTAELRGSFYPLDVAVRISHINHGANPPGQNVGGDIYQTATDTAEDRQYPILSGVLERETRYGFQVSWEVLPGLRGQLQLTRIEPNFSLVRTEWIAGFGWNL